MPGTIRALSGGQKFYCIFIERGGFFLRRLLFAVSCCIVFDKAKETRVTGIITGIGWHMVGAASAASFYAPISKVKQWTCPKGSGRVLLEDVDGGHHCVKFN